jgi:5-methylcytosine-specific restriction endonuclease McrA
MSEAAFFGAVAIPRAYCFDCRGMAFVIDSRLQCCGWRVGKLEIRHSRREADGGDVPRRRRPTKGQRRAIVFRQRNRCYVCLVEFGTEVKRGKQTFTLRAEFDHVVPRSFTYSDLPANFAAACHICNRIKSDEMFDSYDDLVAFVAERRRVRGFNW